MANRNYFPHVLSFNSPCRIQELYFEKCSLEGVTESDWSNACRQLTSLTRLYLDIGTAVPEALTVINSLKSLRIEHDHGCSQAQWMTSMTNLTQLVINVGGKERILHSMRLAVN